MEGNANKMIEKYTGLEYRQTLRTCNFNSDLQIEIENTLKDHHLLLVMIKLLTLSSRTKLLLL